MQRFLNVLKGQAAAQDRGAGQPRFGVVTSVDPTRPAARVSLQPEGVITGWLPLLSPWVGAGWGMASPPNIGDQVLVLPQEGESDHGVIVGRAWSDQARTPAAPVGELWMVHQSGSFIKLANDGTIQMQGDLHVNGDVYDGVGSLNRLRQHYDEHTHADPQGGNTSKPTPQD